MSGDKIANGLSAATLEARWKTNPDSEQRQNPFNLRMRRALSWLARAEQERDDPDAAFIFYWIAFNAAYAEERPGSYEVGERAAMRDYFRAVVSKDGNHVIYDSVWKRFSGPIRILLTTSTCSAGSGIRATGKLRTRAGNGSFATGKPQSTAR